MGKFRVKIGANLVVVVLYLFLLAPVILVYPLSFSGDAVLSFPPSSWSFRWYRALYADPKMAGAFFTSLLLGGMVTVITIAIALPAAYTIVRRRSWVTDVLTHLLTAPLLLPTIVVGLAILIVFANLGLLGNFWGVMLAHLTLTLPYALRVLITSITGLDRLAESAAASLGAPPLVVLRRITLPAMRPGIVAAAALSFLVSFDEVVVTLFLAGPRLTTLPVELYHRVELQADPLVAAVSALVVLVTVIVVVVIDRSVGLSKTFVKS